MITKRVLISGIQGFTGRYMAAEMASSGYEVFGIGVSASTEKNYFQTDLANISVIKQIINYVSPDIVIHLAALTFVGHGNANDFYNVNVIGTRNLLEALSNNIKKPEAVLLASSANIYGNRSEGMLAESTKPDPANDYAVSKLAMEYMANLWINQLPLIITRPFNYTGIGQAEKFLLPKIVTHFKKRANIIELGNLDVWRDFGDVRALVKAYHRLIDARAFGKTVNVCSGKTYSLREVISICEKITNHKIKVEVNPLFVRDNEVKTLCGDAHLLHSLIGDWDTPSLEDTLRWMLQ